MGNEGQFSPKIVLTTLQILLIIIFATYILTEIVDITGDPANILRTWESIVGLILLIGVPSGIFILSRL